MDKIEVVPFRGWTLKAYDDYEGCFGEALFSVRDPEYIPRVGEWVRTDLIRDTPGYISRKITKVEYDYFSKVVYVLYSTPKSNR